MSRFLFAGGGTAGHVNPLLAVADRLTQRSPDDEVVVLGTAEGLESRLVPMRGYELLTIPRLPFPRKLNRAALRFPGAFWSAVRRTEAIIREREIEVVLGVGGYAAAPAYIAAKRTGTPIVVHEQNAKPGLANRLAAVLTKHVGVTFSNTRLPHSRVVGMPLRREIERLDRRAERAAGFAEFGLDPERPVLLVTGGSSGARSINRTVAQAAATIVGAGWQVLHVVGAASDIGPSDIDGYVVLPYCDRMDLAYAAADFVVSRSGAGMVCELTAVGLPSVLVPYPVGNGEQRHNARDVVAAGGAVLVADEAFTPDWVTAQLLTILEDRAGIADMAVRSGSVGHRDGADRMTELVLGAAAGRTSTTEGSMTIKPDLTQPIPDDLGTVHFVGIGGSGMSGIARMFLAAGHRVSGSDSRETATTGLMRELGADVRIGHDADNLGDADTVVVTSALWPDNPELLEARRRGLPVLHRSQALAALIASHRLVAVAGAHGKTTSTGMVVTALVELGLDPSFVNGGVIQSLGTSSAPGSSDLFVVEADESDGSFLLYDVAIALITNVDADHLDHYGSEEAFIEAFVEFAAKARERVVVSSDDAGAVRVTEGIRAREGAPEIVTFGEAEDADVRIERVVEGAGVAVDLRWAGATHHIALRVPGHHNAVNAVGAFAVLVGLGIAPEDAVRGIQAFGGTERRFELHGVERGVSVYDDYAHHPTEVAAALRAARDVVGEGRVIAIHQPHLYSRTRLMAADFAAVYEDLADHTVVLDVYGAREDPEPGVTGALVQERFADQSRVDYLPDWAEASARAAAVAREGDIVMTLSCGDVYRIIPQVLTALHDGPATSEAEVPAR